MKKKLLLIIPLVFILAMVALVIYRHPATTPISIKLDMYKIDRNCTQRGIVPIELTGQWIHPLFEDTRLDITASDFDGMTQLEIVGMASDKFPGAVPRQLPGLTMLECYGGTFNKYKNQLDSCDVVFSPDHQRWMLATEKYFYVGSTNAEDTLEDLYDYFMPAIIGSWPGDPSENDLWQYFGRWVTVDGKISDPVDLEIKTEIQKQENDHEVLKLYCTMPEDFPYIFKENEVYDDLSNGDMAYYISTGDTLDKASSVSQAVYFAYDKEKGWSVFIWENTPEQCLIVSRKPQYDPAEILEHFEIFLESLPQNE